MMRMFVYYWLPGDNDEQDHPNAFEVGHAGSGVKLKDIRAAFPLPGQYHFRFKMKWESSALWMDVTNEESMVPMFEDKVLAKVLRVNWGTAKSAAKSAPSASPDTSPMASAHSEDLLGDSSAAGAASPAKGSVSPRKHDEFDMLFS
ncbi:unnamed protein product [Effrenium voratum]|uniref:DIX domain-containing protein n=1 Tax=Effrenium voratum TaxID=2562239 RepID=A0AA36MQA3_9DINO|nr:unnamed protein product [Effrenium voratum]CAJ1376093.1 unnamed protein product [Effrenium voratum]CAJ1427854.1 unnamed protein product [Effrenium voratum]